MGLVDWMETTKWFYLLDYDGLIVREHVNGVWFIMNLSAALVFLHLLIQDIFNTSSFRAFLCNLYTRPELFLFLFFLGASLMRGWVWLSLAMQNMPRGAAQIQSVYLQSDYWITIAAAVISVIGALGCIRVFSKSHKIWIMCVTLWFVFAVIDIFVI